MVNDGLVYYQFACAALDGALDLSEADFLYELDYYVVLSGRKFMIDA